MNNGRLVGYVVSSTYRIKVLNFLNKGESIPVKIADGTGIRPNHISKVLRELKVKGLIECINPEARKGRIYSITQMGKKINEKVKKLEEE